MDKKESQGKNNSKGILSGIRVLDLTRMLSGPYCSMLLADNGAEVIKVEPVTGDKTRKLKKSGSGYFLTYNRNKRSIALDVKTSEGREVVLKLLSTADVFIENFRPGAMDKLGFGHKELEKINPQLIYCSAKGFLNGPYQHRTALDEVAQMMLEECLYNAGIIDKSPFDEEEEKEE